jgi:PAS domain S-box-containing protein
MHLGAQAKVTEGRGGNNATRVVLNSWDEIARYLRKSVATAKRLEVQQSLPVRRCPGRVRVAVFAYASEIDDWLLTNSVKRNQNPCSDREFRLLWETSPDAMLIVSDSRHVVDANPAACALLSRSRHEIVRFTIEDLTAGAERRKQLPALWKQFLCRGALRGKWVFTRGDAGTVSVTYSARARHLPGRHVLVVRSRNAL